MEDDSRKELRKYSKLCVKSLSDDAEICQQVEHELFGHLEDAYEEERKSASEEEACRNAMRRFGNPEELSSQLADSNARRLSRHAKIRCAVRWLALPILVIGVLLCIDYRGILSSTTLLFSVISDTGYDNVAWERGLKTRHLSVEEKQLFDYYYGKGERLEILSRLHSANPNSLLVCAIYAQELSIDAQENPDARAKLPEALANGRRIDPSNPLYDYLECLVLMREASTLPRVGDKTAGDDALRDRAKLDQAIAVYRRALGKGQIRTYGPELAKQVRGMLRIKEDLLGGMHLIDEAARERLLFLSPFRRIARGVVLYCDLLHKEGDDAQAVELLATWRTFLPQYLGGNDAHLLDFLGGTAVAADYLKCAKRLGAEDEITVLQKLVDLDKKLRNAPDNHLKSIRKGGLLSSLVPPYSLGAEDYAEWEVERRLEAATFETLLLGLACVELLFAIAVLGLWTLHLRLGRRHPFLFIMPRRTYLELFVQGILIPAVLYLVISQLVISAVYLCLLWPIYYGLCSRSALTAWMRSIGADAQDAFRASRSLNLLCLLAVLLVAYGCVLRPITSWRQRYYAGKETLVIPKEGVEILERRVIKKWQADFLEHCK